MVALGFERDRSNTRGLQFRGILRANHTDVEVEVLFPDDTFARLPKLRLVDRAKQFAQVVAHIEDEDRVCYAQEIEMQLDPYRPETSVQRCVQAMTDALGRMLTQDLSAETEAEFPQHWRAESHVYVAEQWLKSGDALLLSLKRRRDTLFVLGANVDSLNRFGCTPTQKAEAKASAARVRVIRLKNRLTFKKPWVQPSALAELLNWAASVEFDLDAKIVTGLAEQPVAAMRVFLSAENGIVGAVATPPPHLVNAKQTKGFGRYLIQHHADTIPITRLTGDRADEKFVIGRNLNGAPGLDGKRIAIVGLGTIGGHLAKLLAQAGAGMGGGHLSLVDQQIFTPGNVGRHVLGFPSIGLAKAVACCDLLKEFYPSISTHAFVENVLRHLGNLNGYDLIVDATGDHPTSTNINKHFVDRERTGNSVPTRLHVWLEGNGAAARAMLADPGSACLDCLTKTDGSERYPVIRSDHPAAITPADCGEGAYFAYGPGASPIAAGLAVQMALSWAAGSASPRLRTIRIVEAATFQTKDQNPTKLAGCRGCAA